MTRTAFQVVGTVVGAYFGQPGLGYAIGSYIGGQVDPQRIPGRKAGELQAQTSAYGQPIQRNYGTVTVVGNVIDANYTIVTNEQDPGKGGSGTVVENESRIADLMISLGQAGAVGIRRIWANADLIYDNSETATFETAIGSLQNLQSVKLYPGGDDQFPDTLFESIHGVGQTPAYTDLSTVVIEAFDCSTYGNQVPQFSFEVQFSGQVHGTVIDIGEIGGAGRYSSYVSSDLSEIVVLHDLGYDPGRNYVARTDFYADRRIYKGAFQSPVYDSSMCIGKGDRPASMYQKFPVTGHFFLNYDGVRYDFFAPGLGYEDCKFYASSDRVYLASSLTTTICLRLYATVDASASWTSADIFYDGDYVWILKYSAPCKLSKRDPETLAEIAEYSLPDASLYGVRLCGHDEFIYVWARHNLFRFNKNSEAWEHLLTADYLGVSTTISFSATKRAVLWIGHKDHIYAYLQDQSPLAGVSLQDIITSECFRSGVDLGGIDATDCAVITVDGYSTGAASAREALAPLLQIFQVDQFESNVLKFIRRGKDPVRTYDVTDLVARDSGYPIEFTDADPKTLPRAASITYNSVAMNYEANTQYAKFSNDISRTTLDVNASVVLDDDLAAQQADKILTEALVRGRTFTLSLPHTEQDLEPSDVIMISAGDLTHRIAIQRVTIGDTVDIDAVADDVSAYSSVAIGSVSGGQYEQSVLPTLFGDAVIIDTPNLTPGDTSPGFYVAGYNYSGQYSPVAIYSNYGRSDYASIGRASATEAIVFNVKSFTTFLADEFSFDVSNKITVELMDHSKSLSSCTTDELLTGNYNVIYYDGEILAFRDANHLGSGVYELSFLIRGLLGTEQFINLNVGQVSYFGAVLSAGGITKIPFQTISETWSYDPVNFKFVNSGQYVVSVNPRSFDFEFVGIKPLEPIRLSGGFVNGDVVFSWIGRDSNQGGYCSSGFFGARFSCSLALFPASSSLSLVIFSGETSEESMTFDADFLASAGAASGDQLGFIVNAINSYAYSRPRSVTLTIP